ncbi:BON domain-containing protein [Pelistega sp. NLN82]|uniref:BON domain-containing protein n=1 Tax=Pelistega ratti TaxID=2652177 RepID=A0A6L9Y3C0_9BURK|nr:BON domain-containing protein [Pelistega ratti]NEN74861.1 BON domain-containing protein [Pelistega ratti]
MKSFSRPSLIALLVSTTLLAGCVTSLIAGAAATTGVVLSDRRSAGMQLTDQTNGITIENRVKDQLNTDITRVIATSFNQRVLLTGQVASQADKERVTQIARSVADVKDVVNELVISSPADFNSRSRDSWITSKVRSELIITKGIPSRTIVITTSQGVVYLMGQVTQQEGNIAAQTAASIDGVVRVVKVFDIISDTAASSNATTTTSTNTNQSSSVTTSPLR